MKDQYCFFTYNKSCKTALLRLKNSHLKNGNTMRPLILLSCREKKWSQAVLPSSQSKSSLADHSRRAQCGGPVFFVLIAAFSPLYIFPLIVAHCQCWLPTMWQLPTETCMTFFFWFEYPSPTSWKPKSWNFWRVAKKKKNAGQACLRYLVTHHLVSQLKAQKCLFERKHSSWFASTSANAGFGAAK